MMERKLDTRGKPIPRCSKCEKGKRSPVYSNGLCYKHYQLSLTPDVQPDSGKHSRL